MSNNTRSNTKKIAKNSIFLYIRLFFALIISLYTSRIVLSMLGEVDFGIYGVVAGFVTMFSFLNTSMTNAIQRFYNFEWGRNGSDSLSIVYTHSLFIQIVLSVLLVVLFESFGVWYIQNIMVIPVERITTALWVFHFSVLSMVLVVLTIPYGAAIMACESMDYYAIIGVLEVLIKLAAAIALQFVSLDKLLFWALLAPISSAFTLVSYFVYCKKYIKSIYIKPVLDKILAKSILSFAGWNLFGTLAGVGKDQGINLVLNFFYGPVVNAARAISVQVNGALMGFVGNVSIAVRPQLIKSYAEGNVSLSLRYMYTITKANYYSFLIIAIVFILEAKFILDAWLGSYPNHTITFIILVLVTSITDIMNAPISMVVHASGKMRLYQFACGGTVLLSIPFAFLFIYFLDSPPEVGLIMILIFSSIRQVLATVILKKIVPSFFVLEYIRDVIVPLIIVTAISFMPSLLVKNMMGDSIYRFLIILCTSLTSVAIATYFVGLNRNERKFIESIIKKHIH